ncbi:MAG: V-type ATPase subunit [Candidatus Bathyarchaeota archaeon]|nr:V-type ATPase subunit [Candidatus Bathyarchaeota archaeon]
MKPLKYKEIMPRVAIEKLKLIDTEDLVNLAGKNLEAIRCALLETSYREDILNLSNQEPNSNSLEEALLENYAQTLKNLVKFSVGNSKNLLLTIIGKIETSNIKTILKAKKTKMNIDEAISNIIPVGFLNKDRVRDILSTSATIEDVIEFLYDTEYGIIIEKALAENRGIIDLLSLELALDQFAYQKIHKTIKKLKGLDKLITKNVLGIEADAKNIKVILRGKAKKIPKDQIKRHFLPSFLISEQTLSNALETADVKTLAECLIRAKEIAENPFYLKIFIEILEQHNSPISQIENILEKASLRISKMMQKKYLKYYNLSYVLVLLNLKWLEIRNLRCLIVGSKRKITSTKVKRLLILEKNY